MKTRSAAHAVCGPTNPAPRPGRPPRVQRFASVIGLAPRKEAYYRELHAAVWPGVLARLRKSHFRNYSIYVATLRGRRYLFSYFEYTGKNFMADMARMAADPTTQEWWAVCIPCQKPLADRAKGEWWADMEEVFHVD